MNLVWALVITFWSYGTPYKTILYQTFPNNKGAYNLCMKQAQAAIFFQSDPADNQTNECKQVNIQTPVPSPN
jgi:hypothetical protein